MAAPSHGRRSLFSVGRLRLPVALVVVAVVVLAWYATWSSADLMMALMAVPPSSLAFLQLVSFLLVIAVMMVAMMLPAALPMMVAFHDMNSLESGGHAKTLDILSTGLFVGMYFVVWSAFGVIALLGLMGLGFLSPLRGPLALIPAMILLAGGAYQITRVKEVCLMHCQSPTSFMLLHWKPGRLGAVEMGLRHSMYCLGCCWLFMIALFVAGSMSLFWMGVLSLVIFLEKAGTKTLVFSRLVGVVLVLLGILAAARPLSGG